MRASLAILAAVVLAMSAAFAAGMSRDDGKDSPHECESLPCFVVLPRGTAEDSFSFDYRGGSRESDGHPVVLVTVRRGEGS